MENTRRTVALVDNSKINLSKGKKALHNEYDVYALKSGDELFQMMREKTPDLILLDVEMPRMNGYEVIQKLKEDAITASIPVIFLATTRGAKNEMKGLSLGAIDYIVKPFSPALLRRRIETHLLVLEQQKKLIHFNNNLQKMVNEKTKTISRLQDALLKTITEMVEFRDDITGGHIERTQSYIQILLHSMMSRGIYEETTRDWSVDFLLQSSQLHDVGKISIPDSILMKPGKLTEEEFSTMKTHTILGVSILEKIELTASEPDYFHHAKLFAGTHHEKWNGTGYPNGLSGQEIPLQGRLMAIADVYDALISKRPYKEPFGHKAAAGIIKEGSGNHFDPVLVELFMEFSDEFYETSLQYGNFDIHK